MPLYFGFVIFGYISGGALAYIIGAAVGIFVAAAIVELLPATEDQALWESGETSAGQQCPHCGSLQTEFTGGQLVCFSCDGAPKNVPANSPNSPFV